MTNQEHDTKIPKIKFKKKTMYPDQNAIKSLVLSNIWGTKENQLI